MNIFKRELKAGIKPFIFWTIGLFVLVFAGMTKFSAVDVGGVSIEDLIASFPRIVQAMLGIVGINIETLGGYYSILIYFAMICIAIYGISLGANAVNREAVDKTYEFVFTKPKSRRYILLMKLKAGVIYLLIFSILCYVFSIAAVSTLNLSENINSEMLLFCVALFLIGLLFFCMSAFIAACVKRAEKGFMLGNLCFVGAFIMGIIYDMLENGGLLRVLSPLKYFAPAELLNGEINIGYLILTLSLCVLFMFGAFYKFNKKDLQATN